MSHWLDIVGVTEAGIAALPPGSRALIAAAHTVLGPERLLAGLDGGDGQTRIAWQSPLSAMLDQVRALRGTPTVVLATGDPSWFGIGATLCRALPADELMLHPAPSAFAYAAARLHWPLDDVATISLHGRSMSLLHKHILPGNRILALTSDAQTVEHAAEMLVSRGYGGSRLAILEHLGGKEERLSFTDAAGYRTGSIGDFHVLGIDCVAGPDAPLLPQIPGLSDAVFLSDGQLTKREVRAITLARLAPTPGALLWDVGAGSGSIGIEWMRAAPHARAIAFEREGERLQMIALNREALGVPGLEIVSGEAPETLEGHAAPDAVFIGCDVASETLFEACWTALKPGGRLVANAVTLASERALLDRQARLGGDLCRIGVSVLGTVGDETVLRPRMAVTQWALTKR